MLISKKEKNLSSSSAIVISWLLVLLHIVCYELLYLETINNSYCHCYSKYNHCKAKQNIYASHYDDVIMGAMVSQITSLTIVYSTVYSDADQRKHQSSPSLAFVWEIYRGPVNFPHKWPVTRKKSPFDDVIMCYRKWVYCMYPFLNDTIVSHM